MRSVQVIRSMASFPKVDSAYREAIASASKDIKAVIDKEHCVPMFIRLAFNDAMTYDASTNTSGCNGTIRSACFHDGLSHFGQCLH